MKKSLRHMKKKEILKIMEKELYIRINMSNLKVKKIVN